MENHLNFYSQNNTKSSGTVDVLSNYAEENSSVLLVDKTLEIKDSKVQARTQWRKVRKWVKNNNASHNNV